LTDFASAAAILDQRLDPALTQPIAVAFSGGGDSLAALIATKAWADRCGRRVIALHVDHGLQPQSGAWAAFAAEAAGRIGAQFRDLAWRVDKPSVGLAAAARRARHGLIAAAARQAGATVVVFGHTADDIAEAAAMRAEGLRLGSLAEWRPSPVWPDGRGVFLLRPLLATRRAAIREALRLAGQGWIDDPANEDMRQPRARARRLTAGAAHIPPPWPDDADAIALAKAARFDDWAAIGIDRAAFRRTSAPAAHRVLAAAMLSAGGGERPPRGERLAALAARFASDEDFTATLAGARLEAGREIVIARDAGETARGGLAPLVLEPGQDVVWDGRFELRCDRPGLSVAALKGRQSRLDPRERARIAAAPAAARAAAPVAADETGRLFCPILAKSHGVEVRTLVGARFLAACSVISKEPSAQS
jgi:tRNA(Ile)-lysidine synthase